MNVMEKQENGNDRINNTQRRELVKLAMGTLDKKIQQARDESGELVGEELGIVAMDMEIKAMEERIQVLTKEKEKLGFEKYQNALLPGSQAKTLVDERSSSACEKIRELEDMKMDSISGIWTANTLSQALSIFNNVRGL
jgi:Rad3-related DNA helicase